MAYDIKFTDTSKPSINIQETVIDETTALTLFGRKRLAYGQEMNENFLRLLENFACPEDSLNPGTPDLDIAVENTLSQPIEGQFWYNSTQECPFIWDGNNWIPLAMEGDIAANWGFIAHGEQLPKPVGTNGYVFDYDECSWIVGPYVVGYVPDYMQFRTDSEAYVYAYTSTEGIGIQEAVATYLIVGIRDNNNEGTTSPIPSITPTPIASSTPTPTVTPTVSLSSTPSGTITPTPTRTPTPTPTRTGTPAGTPPPSGGALFVGLSSSNIYDDEACCLGDTGFDTVISSPVTATPSGGTAPYTYSWVRISGSTAIDADSPTAATTTFSGSIQCGDDETAIFRCTVTDDVLATAFADVEVTLARYTEICASAEPTPTPTETPPVTPSVTPPVTPTPTPSPSEVPPTPTATQTPTPTPSPYVEMTETITVEEIFGECNNVSDCGLSCASGLVAGVYGTLEFTISGGIGPYSIVSGSITGGVGYSGCMTSSGISGNTASATFTLERCSTPAGVNMPMNATMTLTVKDSTDAELVVSVFNLLEDGACSAGFECSSTAGCQTPD